MVTLTPFIVPQFNYTGLTYFPPLAVGFILTNAGLNIYYGIIIDLTQLSILTTKIENCNHVINIIFFFKILVGAAKLVILAGALWADFFCILIKSYDCTFIESLYMYQPYLTYSNKNSVPLVMTK